jgi:steroid 5-alpha reductase family enzyme
MSVATPLIAVLVFMLAVMSAAWITQRAMKNAGWVDVFWTLGTGLSCAAVALWPALPASHDRQWLVAALAIIWSLRLGGYVAIRVIRSKSEDVRYSSLREDWGAKFQLRLFGLIIVQAPATALLAWSVYSATHSSGAWLGLRVLLGVAILAIAIGGEALADEQMRRFKAQPTYGQVNDKGLWAWSRHPNYFFEWFGWLAYPAIGFDPANMSSWPTLIAPALMYLILRYGTGVPALEHNMAKSRGEAFRAYQARVSAFIPLPPKRTAP